MATSPNLTYTIEQFINSSNYTKLSYESLSFLNKINNNELIAYNVLSDYLDEIKPLCVNIELTDIQYLKYLYKPKLLAYDIYGSQELYFILLYINGIASVKEFNFRKLKMIKKDILEQVLSSIYNANKDIIYKNKEKNNIEYKEGYSY